MEVGGRQVRLLMYADDIVLLAESAEDLQRMLDVVTAYSTQWRFRLNPKKGKSEVMLFGRKPRNKNRKWKLAGEEIGEQVFRIEPKSGLSFKYYKDKIVAEARKRMMLVWAMGIREGMLGVEDCVREALVRPVLEYGAIVWGDVKWEQAERVQREMGKMILRCSSKMANEVVLGELGWWTLKGRRDFLTLNYWGKIVGGMSPSRLVYHVYHTSRSQNDIWRNSNNNHMPSMNKWCNNIHTLLKSIDMEDAWHNNELEQSEAKQWRSTIKAKIRDREEMQWRDAMQHKAKLRTYRQLKTELRFEEYLMTRDREAREVMTRLRGGTNELRIETGRYPVTNRDRPLAVSERRCLICMNGEIEDETHFMLDCEEYEDLRQRMLDVVSRTLSRKLQPIEIEKERKTEEGRKKIMAALMGELFTSEPELRAAALHFCKRAMKRRNTIVREGLDQKT